MCGGDHFLASEQELQRWPAEARFGAQATLFYDEHVEADSVHEQIAVRELAGGLAEQDPAAGRSILFGAAACLVFDDLLAEHITESWARGESSLRSSCVAG